MSKVPETLVERIINGPSYGALEQNLAADLQEARQQLADAPIINIEGPCLHTEGEEAHGCTNGSSTSIRR